jgi:redox-sensitive bicupin YhaK (pirin superfamily)
MITVRPAVQRGRFRLDWLDSRHSFSFGEYRDPAHMGFGALRVINDDRVAPGGGFGTHAHRDMEIITYPLAGALEHQDSLGTRSVIRPGEVQRMTAGTGVRHSEHNASQTEPVHFLQIWVIPERPGLEPGYEQKAFPAADRRDRLLLVAAGDGREGAVTIHQDVDVRAALLAPDGRCSHAFATGRRGWLQVARGAVEADGIRLDEGDGAAIEEASLVTITGLEEAELLLFDLA